MGSMDEWSDEQLAALGFEEAQSGLEAVVAELETGRLPLERALTLYQLGLKLRDQCRRRLEAAEGLLATLTETADGTLSLAPSEEPEG